MTLVKCRKKAFALKFYTINLTQYDQKKIVFLVLARNSRNNQETLHFMQKYKDSNNKETYHMAKKKPTNRSYSYMWYIKKNRKQIFICLFSKLKIMNIWIIQSNKPVIKKKGLSFPKMITSKKSHVFNNTLYNNALFIIQCIEMKLMVLYKSWFLEDAKK